MDTRIFPPLACLFFCLPIISATAEDAVSFSREIRPLLSENCFFCHGPDAANRQGDLRLDQRDGALQAVVPGNRADSALMQRLTSEDPDLQMPPPDSHRSLKPSDIERIGQWIDQGAAWGEHWSLEPLGSPTKSAPSSRGSSEGVTTDSWLYASPTGPIDHWIQSRLRSRNEEIIGDSVPSLPLTPSPVADRRKLIRRLTLDLTGLPPTVDEVDQFVRDDSADAYGRLVDRLLASPAFGQRLAWDWLDAARYADTNGYQGDGERTMWPWRDWVVDSYNQNMPFDQFTQWQISGDLLTDAPPEARLATAFLRNHPINGEGGRIAEENRVDYVMDMAETVGTVWLGLTFNCCRCHDHKYDALTQRDYYQFTAFFNQTPVDGGGGNPQQPPVLAWPSPTAAAQIAALEATIADIRTTIANTAPESPELAPLQSNLKSAEDSLQALRSAVPQVMVMQDIPSPRPNFMLSRGLYNEPGDSVTAAVPASLPTLAVNEPPNRLGLAKWLTAKSQPLTARVTVNRIWQHFFGMGLVKTSEDFGVQGEIPRHLELLDYLAITYRDSGWDTKRLIREIVSSHTYQQSSIASHESYAADPENRWLSRGPRYRWPAWMLRDQALAASGLLVNSFHGPSVNAYQPPGVWEEATFGNKQYQQDHGESLYRRSLYIFWRRIAAPTMFFDSAARQVCEVKAIRTNTPLHSLLTLNDATFVEAARVLAERCLTEPKSHFDDQLAFLFQRILCRNPRPKETVLLRSSWQRSLDHYRQHRELAVELLGVGEFPRNPFLSPEEHAAWTAMCLAIFNFDEALSKE